MQSERVLDALAARIESLGEEALSSESKAMVAKAVQTFRQSTAEEQVVAFEREARKAASLREKLGRVERVKAKLESLCKELTQRNTTLSSELRRVAEEQAKQNKELKERFETSLQDITERLKSHTQLSEDNDKLREKLKQLLKLEEIREEHHSKTLAAKDLELQLAEAKRQQAVEVAAAEGAKVQVMQQRLEESLKHELRLQHQIADYAQKFESMDKLFGDVRTQLQKMETQLRSTTTERDKLAKAAAQANLGLIQAQEQRMLDRAEYDRLQVQHDKLKALLQRQLQQRKPSAAAAAGASAAQTTTVSREASKEAEPAQQ